MTQIAKSWFENLFQFLGYYSGFIYDYGKTGSFLYREKMVVRYNQRKNCECDMATPLRIYSDLFPHRNTTMLSPIPLNVTYGPYLSCNDVRHAPDTRGDHEMICTLEANPSKKADHVKWSLESGEDIESNGNFMINTTEEPLKVIIALELGIQSHITNGSKSTPLKSSFSLKQIISKITIKHDYIENEKKLDLIFGLADESKVLQVIVHYERFIDVNKASGVTSKPF